MTGIQFLSHYELQFIIKIYAVMYISLIPNSALKIQTFVNIIAFLLL